MGKLIVLLILFQSSLSAQRTTLNGTISGSLTGEDGTSISGGRVSLRLIESTLKCNLHQTSWTSATNGSGAFSFTGLPWGKYTLCANARGTTWLNPCEWGQPVPVIRVSSRIAKVSANLTLRRGAAIPVRIDDPGQLLDKHEGKTPRARLLIGLGSPGFVFRLLPVVSKDSGGRRHEIAVPFDTPLTLVIRNSYFQVDDEAGARLSSSQARVIPLTVRPGQQVATVKLTVKGAGT